MLMLVGDLQRQWPGEFGAIRMTEVMFAFLISKQILSLVLTLLEKYTRVYKLYTNAKYLFLFFFKSKEFLFFRAVSELAIYFEM